MALFEEPREHLLVWGIEPRLEMHAGVASDGFSAAEPDTRARADLLLTQPNPHGGIREMPLAVTIETEDGDVGVVHAESPHHCWTKALELLESGHGFDIALLGFPQNESMRRRDHAGPVEGVRALVHGHRPVVEVERIANRWNIDTGAGIPQLNRLSILELNAPELRTWTFDVDEGCGSGHRDVMAADDD